MYAKIKYRADEEMAKKLLENEGSTASAIYGNLKLTRSIIEETLTRLHNDRRQQMVFASIVCATRFKTIADNNELQAAKCMRCGAMDTFEHMLHCCHMENTPQEGSAEMLFDYIIKLVREAAKGAPVIPIRLPLPAPDQISLDIEGNISDVQSDIAEESSDSLSFD